MSQSVKVKKRAYYVPTFCTVQLYVKVLPGAMPHSVMPNVPVSDHGHFYCQSTIYVSICTIHKVGAVLILTMPVDRRRAMDR